MGNVLMFVNDGRTLTWPLGYVRIWYTVTGFRGKHRSVRAALRDPGVMETHQVPVVPLGYRFVRTIWKEDL